MNNQKRQKRKQEKQRRRRDRLCRQRNQPFRGPTEASGHEHEWVVFGTALTEGWLMLQCAGCGLHGTVEDPSSEEWSEAYHAPSKPYRWHDEARVVVKGHLSGDRLYVVRAAGGLKCECYAQKGVLEPGDYERFPVAVMNPALPLTDDDRHELQMLAGVAVEGALCSTFLPAYLKCFEEDTGQTHGEAVREVARRIEAIDRMGLHCSPAVVARLLAQIADSTPTTKGV